MTLLHHLHDVRAPSRWQGARRLLVGLVCLCFASGRAEARDFEIATFRRRLTVQNPSALSRSDAAVVVPCRALADLVVNWGGVEVSERDVALPVQLDDLDQDGTVDEIVFLVDLGPRESKELCLTSLRTEEAGPVLGRRTNARGELKGIGYPALESERASYGIRCSAPKGQAALELEVLAKKPGFTLDAAEGEVTTLEAPPGSLGLGGPVIGKSRPRDGDNAVVLDRVLCTGPLRAGVQVDVLLWRSDGGGEHRARLQYYMYAGQEFVELRASVRALKPADEHFGVGVALFGDPSRRFEDWQQGFIGHWGRPSHCPTGLGLGLLFRPQAVDRVVGVGSVPSWLPGNQIVYFKPALTTREEHTWRVLLAAEQTLGRQPSQGAFASRLAYLAKSLREPITVDRKRGKSPAESRAPAAGG